MFIQHYLEIENRKVYYWQRNPTVKKTMVFVHGFKGNHKGLTEISAHFSQYRTIALDLPGFGQSDELPEKHTIENYADFLFKFTQTLNLSEFDLVGHSYGGSISIVYAGKYSHTLSHLILISPAIPQDSISQTLAELQLNINKKLPKSWQKAWLASPIVEVASLQLILKTVSHKRKLELMAAGIRNTKEQRPQVITECLTSFLNTPYYKFVAQISAPTYILAGETDFIAPLKSQVRIAEKINLSKVDLLPEVSHLAPLERPGTVGRLIEQYMDHNPTRPSHVHLAPNQGVTIQPKNHKKIAQTTG